MNEIIGIIPHKFRRRGFGVACTLLLRAGLNFLGLAVLLPVLALALDARSLDGGGQLARIYTALGFTSPRSFALTVCAAVVAVIVLKCLTNLWLARIERNYIYDLYRTLSRRLYIAYHDRGLAFINNSNSSVLARNVNVVCLAFAAGVLRPAAAMIAEAMLFVLLFASLALYTPLAALLSVVIFLPAVWLYYALVRNRINRYGEQENRAQREKSRLVAETFRGYADIELSGAFPGMLRAFDRTMDENPAIAMSFRNQFVPSINYTYTFERTYGATGNRRFYWQNSVTSAGNILSGVLSLFGSKQPQHLFGNRFSQFVKEVSEVKFYHRIGRRNNWLATRLLVGAGYAYGNSEVMPYSEQFYIGGANSIRAFTIRSLGPGSYRPPADDRNGYLDQTGDFKLEANIEYRFGIMGRLNGAVFLDTGNIWLLKKDPKRPGAELKWKGFLNDIALGTGFGLRYDISYLVIRADLGIGLHTPYPNPDKKGYYNISSFKDGLGFHLAIGYPF